MRVGRINSIRLMPYRDVKTLLRFFSVKGVAQGASRQNELAKINTLQPYDDSNINQKINSRNSLNNMVIDSIEKITLSELEKNNNLDSDRTKIEVIKAMRNARKGSKITALDLLAKSDIKSGLLGIQNKIDTDDIESIKKNEIILNENKVEIKFKKKEDETVSLKVENEGQEKSLIEEYTKMLKEIDSKNEEEKKNREFI